MTNSKPFGEWPEVMTVNEAVECTGLPRDDMYRIFKRPDFPLAIPGKKAQRKVGKYALRQYLNKGAMIE